MEKLWAVIAMAFAITQAHAQKMNAKDVPVNVKSSLEKNYAIKNADWDNEGLNYEASFEQKGKETSVVFDHAGFILEIEIEIKKNELPGAVLETLKKDYADFELEEAAKIESKGVITYETEIEKGEQTFDLIFDALGKVIRKESKENDEKD